MEVPKKRRRIHRRGGTADRSPQPLYIKQSLHHTHEFMEEQHMSVLTMPEVQEADFDLDLQITSDAATSVPMACATDDGCAPSCASSCISTV
ncbi:FxLD family lanthipeptide [Lentzea sp. NPDC054927]